jgi:ABC-type glycerol-3-phosphate transport system substrate-binding protein
MNKVEVDDDIHDEFGSLFGLASVDKSFLINEKCVIYNNEAFDQCKDLGVPLVDMVNDKNDYRELAKAAKADGKAEEAERLVKMALLKMIAVTAQKNLDQVFKALF